MTASTAPIAKEHKTMSRALFITLPVADLERSIAFFSALGFAFDPAFTNANGACLLISEHSRVMLAVRPFFAGLAGRPVADAHASAQMLLALSCESREEVDALVAKAVAAGGSTPNAAEDHGFMYDHGFEDLDGHLWGVFWTNEAWTNDAASPPSGA